jgi:hypothetical protein|tara:strand:+ start:900 stop:1586 length:687 start_codon:yes stop_codon:yes gene_type:complete
MNWDEFWNDDFCNLPRWNNCNNNTKKKKGNKMNLENGDRVRLAGGKRPMTVSHAYRAHNGGAGRYRVTAQYEGSGAQITRYDHEFVRLDDDYETESKGIDKMKGKLFQTKEETPRFGIGLAVNSQNEYVLEMKVTGALEAFTMKKDSEQLEVVMPYSFAVKYSTGPQLYQFRGSEGSVTVGDLLLSLNSQHAKGGITIGQVVEINTKSDKATKSFDGMKIVTEPLDGE